MNVNPVLELRLAARVVGASVREPGSLLVMGVSGKVARGPEEEMPVAVAVAVGLGMDVMLPVVALSEREGMVVAVELRELVVFVEAEGSLVFEVKFAVMALSDKEGFVVLVALIVLMIVSEGSPVVAL